MIREGTVPKKLDLITIHVHPGFQSSIHEQVTIVDYIKRSKFTTKTHPCFFLCHLPVVFTIEFF